MTILPLAFMGMGPYELLIIGVVAVLLFGSKLPDVAKSLGKSYREFRTGLSDIQSAVDTDTYSDPGPSSPSSSSYSNDYYDDDMDEPTAPKFDPPPAEPKASSKPKSDDGPAEDEIDK